MFQLFFRSALNYLDTVLFLELCQHSLRTRARQLGQLRPGIELCFFVVSH